MAKTTKLNDKVKIRGIRRRWLLNSVSVVALIIVLSFFLSGAYGVTSSMLTETKVPVAIFGSASGILSVIGFLPDMFVSPIAGKWLDTYDTTGAYTRIFGVLAVSAVLAMICAWLVRVYKKKALKEN